MSAEVYDYCGKAEQMWADAVAAKDEETRLIVLISALGDVYRAGRAKEREAAERRAARATRGKAGGR